MGILVGVVLAYDEASGRARVGVRSLLRRGGRIQIVGGRTDVELKLKAPRFCAPAMDLAGAWRYEMDILTPSVEVGDMVFHIVSDQPAFAPAVA